MEASGGEAVRKTVHNQHNLQLNKTQLLWSLKYFKHS